MNELQAFSWEWVLMSGRRENLRGWWASEEGARHSQQWPVTAVSYAFGQPVPFSEPQFPHHENRRAQ